MKKSNNPLQEKLMTCGAHARTTGQPCQNAPVTGSTRCRMHGGKGSGRPVVTGNNTRQAKKELKQINDLIASVNDLIEEGQARRP